MVSHALAICMDEFATTKSFGVLGSNDTKIYKWAVGYRHGGTDNEMFHLSSN